MTNKTTKINIFRGNYNMTNELLKAVVEMPLSAASYMRQRNKFRVDLHNAIATATIDATPAQVGKIKAYYLLVDLYNEKFARQMGWM
ncbi:hypothetical protein [Limosilactobacillus reuteri]|uniref:hypothetical protein n=1 Tax=Limosilactobacillus reuteri TaxID=1598 RepID=UPI00232CD16F|nr:hypothetical protein [Limosilactobacillus reuteri]